MMISLYFQMEFLIFDFFFVYNLATTLTWKINDIRGKKLSNSPLSVSWIIYKIVGDSLIFFNLENLNLILWFHARY